MAINCIIIDDELEALEGLELLLQSDGDINILKSCSNGLDAIESINQLKPDLILLDIQMPGANGFEVLQNLTVPLPEVIFITAYDQFALKAFEVHALDYLLKPFNDERFFEALNHAKRKLKIATSREATKLVSMAKEAIKSQQPKSPATLTSTGKLALKSDGKIHFIDRDQILWVEAYDYYIKVHLGDKYLLVRESMKNILQKLGDAFIRIHKSTIANTFYIKAFNPLPNSELEIELENGQKLKVSRSHKPRLMEVLTKK